MMTGRFSPPCGIWIVTVARRYASPNPMNTRMIAPSFRRWGAMNFMVPQVRRPSAPEDQRTYSNKRNLTYVRQHRTRESIKSKVFCRMAVGACRKDIMAKAEIERTSFKCGQPYHQPPKFRIQIRGTRDAEQQRAYRVRRRIERNLQGGEEVRWLSGE